MTSAQAGTVVDRLEDGGGAAPIELRVDIYPDYLYDLVDGLPTLDPDPYPGLSENDLTSVTQTFQSDGYATLVMETRSPTSPCTCLLAPVFDMAEPGSTRVDHVIDNGSRWQQRAMVDMTLQAQSASRPYDGATPATVQWFGGAVGAGLRAGLDVTHAQAPATTAGGELVFQLGVADGAGHHVAGPFDRSGSVTRDGDVVVPDFTGQATLPASEQPAKWRVLLETGHDPGLWKYSTSVTSVWDFTAAGHPDDDPVALPMLEAQTEFPVDAHSERVTDGQLTVTPWRLDDVDPSSAQVTLALSWNGGLSWSLQDGHWVGDSWVATPVQRSGSVDVHLVVTDADGSTLTRFVEDAWLD